MRRRLLLITALNLLVIVAAAAALAYVLQRSSQDVGAAWARLRTAGDAALSAASHLGRLEASLREQASRPLAAAPHGVAEIEAALGEMNGFEQQRTRMERGLRPGELRTELADLRLAEARLRQLVGTSPGLRGDGASNVVEAAELAGRLRQTFDRLWPRMSEAQDQEVAAHVARQRRESHALLVVVVLASLVGGALVIYHIFQVVDLLDDFCFATQRLARGDWDHRISAPAAAELRQIAEGFNQMAEALRRAEARRLEAAQEMVVTLRHEVGNSLASVSGLVQLLLRHRQELPASAIDSLGRIEATIERLGTTVSRLQTDDALHVADYPGGGKMLQFADAAEPPGHQRPQE